MARKVYIMFIWRRRKIKGHGLYRDSSVYDFNVYFACLCDVCDELLSLPGERNEEKRVFFYGRSVMGSGQ